MHKVCNIDIRNSEGVFREIERYKEVVIKELNPKRIILFGSLARGDFNEGSDIDILVIADWIYSIGVREDDKGRKSIYP